MRDVRFSVLMAAGLALVMVAIATGHCAYAEDRGQLAALDGDRDHEREDRLRPCLSREVGEDFEAGRNREKEGGVHRCFYRYKSKQNRGTRVQAIFTPTPPPPPPGWETEKKNGTLPPVPQGPFVPGRGQQIPFTQKGLAPPSSVSPSPLQPDAPGDFHFIVNNGVSAPKKSFSTSEPEPSVAYDAALLDKAVLYTGNAYAAVSKDDGAHYTFIDPFNLGGKPPPPSGGFCCDQHVIYEPSRDLYFWVRQYKATFFCNPDNPLDCTGNNIYRIAWAHGATAVLNGSWCTSDFTPQDLGWPAGYQLDYPHVALSSNFFYFSANVYLVSDGSANGARGTSLARLPLDPLVNCDGFGYDYLRVTDHFDFNIAHGATDTIYWATINTTSSIRVYTSPEDSGTIFVDDVDVRSWQPGSSPCPDLNNVDWCSNRGGGGGRSGTGWSNGLLGDARTVGFMWNAAACTDTSKCAHYRPWPYIRVISLNQFPLQVIDDLDFWNPSYAWHFPGVNVNERGHLGGAIFVGGDFPTLVAFIWDDFSCNPFNCGWENYAAADSSASFSTWGDYVDARPAYPLSTTWVATGWSYGQLLGVLPQFMWFGRERDLAGGPGE